MTNRTKQRDLGVRTTATLAVSSLAMLLAGCTPGIKWKLDTYEHVQADSRRDSKLTFIYFRHWSAIACTTFEENVLSDPAVLQATADLNCVPLDFHWDRPLADRWEIENPPAVLIMAPDDRVLTKLTGDISLGQLLAAIDQAKQVIAPATNQSAAP